MTYIKPATESELKFTLTDDTARKLRIYLNQSMQAQPALFLSNTYFDTSDRVLHRQRIGCRIRRWTEHGKDQAEQTIKLAGSSQGGLHSRPEYNVPLGKQQMPDLTSFPPQIWPDEMNLRAVNEGLEEIFTVSFKRERWHWKRSNDQQSVVIEIVLDDGFIQAGATEEKIFEVEMELITGSVDDLRYAGDELRQFFTLQPCEVSKAQRGFALADKARE